MSGETVRSFLERQKLDYEEARRTRIPPTTRRHVGPNIRHLFLLQRLGFQMPMGTAFEELTGKNIYDALQTDIAEPIGMQD